MDRSARAPERQLITFAWLGCLVLGAAGLFVFGTKENVARALTFDAWPHHNHGCLRHTKLGAASVSSAAVLWTAEHVGRCPKVVDLIEDGELDGHRRTADAWGHTFEIECSDDGISARSAGPDGVLHTQDDILG